MFCRACRWFGLCAIDLILPLVLQTIGPYCRSRDDAIQDGCGKEDIDSTTTAQPFTYM